MAWYDFLIPFTYLFVFIIGFWFGFIMVRKNLKKINLIESEKFDLEDWIACIGFGAMFGLAIVFAVNLTFEVISPIEIPSVAGLVLTILFGILIIYPLWEVIFLGRPTSDSVHEIHRFLETKILDKFHGKKAYFVSFLIFLGIYILPITLINIFADRNFIEIAFIWFLIIPLFFLAYYAALGQMSNIIGTYYASNIKNHLIYGSPFSIPVTINKIKGIIFFIVALVPLFTSIYGIYSPISTLVAGGGIEEKGELMAYLSLFSTVVFGIIGFFKKFWSRKSKTKIVDFLFSGYIFIAIGVNMLINFIAIDSTIVQDIIGYEIFGYQPLAALQDIMSDYVIIIPIITIQSIITVVYGLYLLVKVRSDFHADVRLSEVNKAFGLKIEQLINKDSDQIKRRIDKSRYNLPILYKSILIPPVYDKEGLDLNASIRKKASQFLYLIAMENKDLAKEIVEILSKTTIERFNHKKKWVKSPFLSKEAVDLLGIIGKEYPDLVLGRLIKAMDAEDILTKEYIMDALGDIGESSENLSEVLKVVRELIIHPRYEIRNTAVQTLTEIILEGEIIESTRVQDVLDVIYSVLERYPTNADFIDSAMDALANICVKIPKKIYIDKILPFLKYKNKRTDKITVDFIHQNTVYIIGTIAYHNLDKFPVDQMIFYAEDSRAYIRYRAIDALGNYLLRSPNEEHTEKIITLILNKSLIDPNSDVRDMCIESISEFLIVHENYVVTINGNMKTILEFYTNALDSCNSLTCENSSEALKSIAPIYQEDIINIIEKKIVSGTPEVTRDIMHTIASMDGVLQKKINLAPIYERVSDRDPRTRSEAVFALGGISENKIDVDEQLIISRLDDEDTEVRLTAIFALQKIGLNKPNDIIPILIERLFKIDRVSDQRINEVELYIEALGVIGEKYPSNEIIVSLQQAIMGDTNSHAKDVIANSIWRIGNGMIKSGRAIRRIENSQFYNSVSWLKIKIRKDYTIGNLIIMMIEALQQKGIPDSVMNIISDSMQDLLPVFTFVKNEQKRNQFLITIKELLAQAYFSNYNQEILETIDRIDSLISFRNYFEVSNPKLKNQFIFYSKQYTHDGKQFYDQGITFMQLINQDPKYLDYAKKSFEIAIQISPFEYFSPNAIYSIGNILQIQKKYDEAEKYYKKAMNLFEALDEIESMKLCEEKLEELKVIKV